MKRIISCSFIIILLLLLIPYKVSAENGTPYVTYTEDHRHQLIRTQDAYIPLAVYRSFGQYQLKGPEDLVIDKKGNLYIADTGNSRILVIEKNLTSINVIGSDILSKPTGVYVDADGFIYVADQENLEVYKFDNLGNLIKCFGRPTEPMFGKKTLYRPSKLTVDNRGNIYIISEGTYNGIIQLSANGDFLGFYGSNATKPSLRTKIIKAVFPQDVVEDIFKITPITPNNIARDEKGLIYTITRGTEGDAIKRLNISGINKMATNLNTSPFFTDITIGPINNIYTVADDGFIREYDAEGNLLFQFGGKDNRTYYKGLFNIPSAIAVDDSFNLYVLDREKHELQVFIPTNFSTLVHNAIKLYQEGLYLESKQPWEQVLRFNSMFDLAHKGIGHAYYKEGMYKEALEEYKIAGYKEGYSDAYWEIRNNWLLDNLSYILLGFIIIYLLFKIQIWVCKKNYCYVGYQKLKTYLRKFKLFREIQYMNYFKRNPSDACYGIKREKKVSFLAATILYLILYLEKIFAIYFTGFSFNNYDIYNISLFQEAIKVLGPLFLFVISNYLVTAISDGEGKFSDVYIGTISSLTPIIVFWPLVVILSRFLTLNEAFLIKASMFVLYGYSAVLIFVMVKEIHNYTISKTIKIFLITAFTMVMFVVSILLLNGLTKQLYEFVYQFTKEVTLRV